MTSASVKICSVLQSNLLHTKMTDWMSQFQSLLQCESIREWGAKSSNLVANSLQSSVVGRTALFKWIYHVWLKIYLLTSYRIYCVFCCLRFSSRYSHLQILSLFLITTCFHIFLTFFCIFHDSSIFFWLVSNFYITVVSRMQYAFSVFCWYD